MNTKTNTKTNTMPQQPNAREIRAQYAAERALSDVQAKRRSAKAQARKAKWAKGFEVTRALVIGLFVLAIAVIALVASFQHLRHLCMVNGQDATTWYGTANLIPISIDLMMFVASFQLRRKGITRTAVMIARSSMLGGLLVSLAGNVYDGLITAPAGESGVALGVRLAISAIPVLALLGASEMLTHTHKDRKVTKRRGLLAQLVTALIVRVAQRPRRAAGLVTATENA